MNTCGYIALPVKLTKRREVTANAVIRKGELTVIEIFSHSDLFKNVQPGTLAILV